MRAPPCTARGSRGGFWTCDPRGSWGELTQAGTLKHWVCLPILRSGPTRMRCGPCSFTAMMLWATFCWVIWPGIALSMRQILWPYPWRAKVKNMFAWPGSLPAPAKHGHRPPVSSQNSRSMRKRLLAARIKSSSSACLMKTRLPSAGGICCWPNTTPYRPWTTPALLLLAPTSSTTAASDSWKRSGLTAWGPGGAAACCL